LSFCLLVLDINESTRREAGGTDHVHRTDDGIQLSSTAVRRLPWVEGVECESGGAAGGDQDGLQRPGVVVPRPRPTLPLPAHVGLVARGGHDPRAPPPLGAEAVDEAAQLRRHVLHGAVVPPGVAAAAALLVDRPTEVADVDHHRPAPDGVDGAAELGGTRVDVGAAHEAHVHVRELQPEEVGPGEVVAALEAAEEVPRHGLRRGRRVAHHHGAALLVTEHHVQHRAHVGVDARAARRRRPGSNAGGGGVEVEEVGMRGRGGGGGRRRRRDERGLLLEVGLDGGAGEAGLAHDAADAWVVEDGDQQLVQVHLDGQQRRLLLRGRSRRVELDAPAALVGLRALERGDQRVGQRGAGLDQRRREGGRPRRRGRARRGGGGGEPVQRHVEAELQRAALERVRRRRVGAQARALQEPRNGGGGGGGEEMRPGEEREGDVQRRDLRMAAAPRQAQRQLQHRRRLRGERLVDRVRTRAHPSRSPNLHPRSSSQYVARTLESNGARQLRESSRPEDK
jgi:hypothetical protein